MVDRGYDVWMGNARGTKYSNVHERDSPDSDSPWTLKERWNFSWADKGRYDLPAFIDKILEVTGEPKVTVMAYSGGGAAAYYGMAKD